MAHSNRLFTWKSCIIAIEFCFPVRPVGWKKNHNLYFLQSYKYNINY